MDFDLKLDPKAIKKLEKVERGLILAQIRTVNKAGLLAGIAQRKELKKDFVLRTKWTEGSIRPKHRAGRNSLGLIPEHKKSLKNAYLRTGSVADYLREQQEGWTAHDPMIPTNKARVSRSYKKKIRKKASLKYIRSRRPITPGPLKGVSRDKQVSQFIAILKKTRYKGYIHIKNKNHVLPQGYYKMRNRKTLDLLRYHDEGSHKRRATRWHEKAMQNPMIFKNYQAWYNRNARIILSRAGIK